MALSQFWRERQAEFEKYQQEFRDLKAHWYVSGQTWWLQCGESSEGILNPPEQALDVFKAIARTVVAGWTDIRAEVASKPYPRVAANAEPWEVWLDFMRVREWGFQVTGNVACTEWEWNAVVTDGKPLAAVRREQQYTTGDEWKKVCQRTESGELRQLTARELKGKSSEDLQKYYHCLEDGTVEHVFESSARFCEDLAARAFEAEAAAGLAGGGGSRTGRRAAAARGTDGVARPQFLRRASWLKDRLLERGWSNSDPSKYRGPDRKTIEKILRGEAVRNDVLEKLAEALSRKDAKVNVLDIPQD